MLHYEKVSDFNNQHPLTTEDDNTSFTDSVLKWHTGFTTLIVSIQRHLRYISEVKFQDFAKFGPKL